ncbi:MAG: hypothetical protein EBE86_020065 [Hormoscilla sp. GUM202]|nr:hypothetical protein [Hormoscilla sp. GUM202]
MMLVLVNLGKLRLLQRFRFAHLPILVKLQHHFLGAFVLRCLDKGFYRLFIEMVLEKATDFQILNEGILARAEEIEATMNIKGLPTFSICGKVGG